MATDDVRRTVTDLSASAFTYTAAIQAQNFPNGVPTPTQLPSASAGM